MVNTSRNTNMEQHGIANSKQMHTVNANHFGRFCRNDVCEREEEEEVVVVVVVVVVEEEVLGEGGVGHCLAQQHALSHKDTARAPSAARIKADLRSAAAAATTVVTLSAVCPTPIMRSTDTWDPQGQAQSAIWLRFRL